MEHGGSGGKGGGEGDGNIGKVRNMLEYLASTLAWLIILQMESS